MRLDTSVKELNGGGDKTYKALSSNGTRDGREQAHPSQLHEENIGSD